MSAPNDEFTLVEQPLLRHLEAMGWETFDGDETGPAFSNTISRRFTDVLLHDILRQALRRINRDDGHEWLDAARLDQAVSVLERGFSSHHLLDINEHLTELLQRGTPVAADPDRNAGRKAAVRFIDFDDPLNNTFTAVRQFRVDAPGGQSYIVPDVVLFVNGIPLAVVECKAPGSTNPMAAAISQLLRYSNCREEGVAEGAEPLFWYNQLTVATCGTKALVGTVGARPEHYLEWKDATPRTADEVKAEAGSLTAQDVLAAGLLRPANLLDVLNNFVLFRRDGGRLIKLVPRYQQYRAVHKAVQRLLTRQGDDRGGIVWHTQGSGKSLTMVYLVRKLRSSPAGRAFKVVIVTDRNDLEKQLSKTMELTGESLTKAKSAADLQKLLLSPAPDLISAKIQQYRESDEPGGTDDPVPLTGSNPSASVLVLVDEAHRSHASALHANLLSVLPHSARIGFTGTPILTEGKKKTHEIFGPFIDEYKLKDAEADGAVVPIRYEAWGVEYHLDDGRSLDGLFDDYFKDHDEKQREAIKEAYATKITVMESAPVVGTKAKHMLDHYVENVLPGGLKAQVVAVSRKAAVEYAASMQTSHGELIDEIVANGPADRGTERSAFLARAHGRLDAIRRLEFAAVVSGSSDDPAGWAPWNDEGRHAGLIDRFTKPLTHADPQKADGLAFLCVKSMLLTGFDAPVEGVMYLDRPMKGHELLQAIARVNRTYPGKAQGLVVDYVGVGRNLARALKAYEKDDIDGAMKSLLEDELPRLEKCHAEAVAVFTSRGVALADRDACVQALSDLRVRGQFAIKLRTFLGSLNAVMPRPQALKYLPDARTLGEINRAARNLYRDEDLVVAGAGAKVEEMIEQHLRARGIDPKVPPVAVTAANFFEAVDAHASPRAKASEMEHAARHHLRVHLGEDPVHYRKLSERLEELLTRLADDWDKLVASLRSFVEEVRGPAGDAPAGLASPLEAPFYRLLAESAAGTRRAELPALTTHLVRELRRRVGVVDFWRNAQMREELANWVRRYLDDEDLVPWEQQEAAARAIVELANHQRTRLAADG